MFVQPVEEVPEVQYFAPTALAEALALLQQYGESAKLIAGGQSLLIFLRQGLIAPDVLIGLKNVPELRGITVAPDGALEIGAMVRQVEIEAHPLIRSNFTALWEASSAVASTQVRNQGTIGGNLCHADPTADPPAALIALGAQLQITGAKGIRSVPVEAFFTDYLSVDLAPDEILTGLRLLAPAPGSASAYLKLRVRPIDVAIVGAAAWVQRNPDTGGIQDLRIGLAGAALTPIRAIEAEQILRGAALSDDHLREAAEAAAANCAPLSDLEASDWYRREMVQELVTRVVKLSYERAG